MGKKLFVVWVSMILALGASTLAHSQSLPLGDLGLPGDGASLSMALRSDSLPTLAAHNSASASLRYFEPLAGTWHAQTVVTALTHTSGISLAHFGSAPSLAFVDSAQQRLLFATRINGTWLIDHPDPGTSVSGRPSLATCGSALCITYYDHAAKNLKLARGTRGSWSLATLDSTSSDVGYTSSITRLPNGRIAVAYIDRTARTAKLAVDHGNGFSFEVVPHLHSLASDTLALRCDSQGKLHLAASLDEGNVPIGRGTFYATKSSALSGTWSVSALPSDYTGGDVALAPRSDATVVVLARFQRKDRPSSYVRLHSLQSTGVWARTMFRPHPDLSFHTQQFQNLQIEQSATTYFVAYRYFDAQGRSRIRLHSGTGDSEENFEPEGRNIDSDGDGLLDSDELHYGTDPYRIDSDGDGVDDAAEIADGTDPLDRGSFRAALNGLSCSYWERLGDKSPINLSLSNSSNLRSKARILLTDRNGRSLGNSQCTLGPRRGCRLDIARVLRSKKIKEGQVCVSHSLPPSLVRGSVRSEDGYAKKRSERRPATSTLSSGSYSPLQLLVRHRNARLRSGTQQTTSTVVVSNNETYTTTGLLEVIRSDGVVLARRNLRIPARGFARLNVSVREFGMVRYTPVGGRASLSLRRTDSIRIKNRKPKTIIRSVTSATPARGGSFSLPYSAMNMTKLVIGNGRAYPLAVPYQVFNAHNQLVDTQWLTLPANGTSIVHLESNYPGIRRGRVIVWGNEREALTSAVLSEARARDGSITRVRFVTTDSYGTATVY